MTDFSQPGKAPLGLSPHCIAGFTLDSILGRGSSSTVYAARQHHPERAVALKILVTAGRERRGRERFEREIALMASIEHPNITRLYGTGVENAGSGEIPYLVMERVAGVDLMSYCAAAAPALAARIELLATIARAVHHAHARGVMHRDLKPQNILVGADGVPRILDFGIARHSEPGPEDALLTRQGEVLGTLPYMAPEQIDGRSGQIDVRVDVYALGVIGYQLVAGRLPYPDSAFATVIGALETLRDSPPELQPDRLVAAKDLRTVLSRAMSSRPQDRYDSALELALDLERYCQRQPVLARRPSLWHGTLLFMLRHRTLSIAAGIAALSLGLGLGAAVHYGRSEAAARAREAQRVEDLASTNRFMRDMLLDSAPIRAHGAPVSLHQLLDQARAKALVDREMSPSVAIRVLTLLGSTYLVLNDADAALQLLEDAVKRAAQARDLDPDVRDGANVALGEVLAPGGEARRAIGLLMSVHGRPPGDTRDSRTLWLTDRLFLVNAYIAAGELDHAEAILGEFGDRAVTWFGADDEHAIELAAARISIDYYRGRFDAALREAAEYGGQIERLRGRQDPQRIWALVMEGACAPHVGHLGLARARLAEAADLYSAVYGAESANSLEVHRKLADVEHQIRPQDPGPIEQLRRLSSAEVRLLGETDPLATAAVASYARALIDAPGVAGAQRAEVLLRGIVDAVNAGRRPQTSVTLRAQLALGTLLQRQERLAEARQLLQGVRDDGKRVLGPQHETVRLAVAALEDTRLAAVGPGGH